MPVRSPSSASVPRASPPLLGAAARVRRRRTAPRRLREQRDGRRAGADAEPATPRHPRYPLTIDNCGTEVTFEAAPERVVTIKSSTLELLLALGLEDRVVGTAFSDGPVPDEYADAASGLEVLSDKVPSQEVTLAAEPDLVFAGWESNLSAEGAGDRDTLATARRRTPTSHRPPARARATCRTRSPSTRSSASSRRPAPSSTFRMPRPTSSPTSAPRSTRSSRTTTGSPRSGTPRATTPRSSAPASAHRR